MKNILTTVIIGVISILASCSQDESKLTVIPELPSTGNINLSEILEGQKSMYLKFESSCEDLDGDLKFTGDTLIVEITSDKNQFYFNESVTEYSPMYQAGGFTSPVKHAFNLSGDDILIPERFSSPLFYFYGNDTIRLNPEKLVKLKQNSCQLMLGGEPFIGNEIGIIEDLTLGAYTQNNKIAVSCVPSILNMDAYLIYDQYQLYMSITSVEGNFVWEGVSGWMLIE